MREISLQMHNDREIVLPESAPSGLMKEQ